MGVVTKLEDEFNNRMNELSQTDYGTDDFNDLLDGSMKLADRLIQIQKNNDEYDLKSREIEAAKEARAQELEQTKTRNRIDWAKVIVPTVGAFAMGIISMVWEKTDTLTSTTGKTSLRELVSFRLK